MQRKRPVIEGSGTSSGGPWKGTSSYSSKNLFTDMKTGMQRKHSASQLPGKLWNEKKTRKHSNDNPTWPAVQPLMSAAVRVVARPVPKYFATLLPLSYQRLLLSPTVFFSCLAGAHYSKIQAYL